MPRIIGKSILTFCVFMLVSTSVLADKIEKIKSRGYMIAGISKDSPPFSFIENGQLRGFEVDIVSILAQKIGVNIKYKTPEGPDPLAMLQQGTVDLVAAQITHSFSNEEKYDFSSTYFVGGQRLLTKDSLPFQKMDDLQQHNIGVVSNEMIQSILKNRFPDSQIHDFDNLESGLKALDEETVAALSVEVIPYCTRAYHHEAGEETVFLKEYLLELPIGLALPENESNFRDLINRTLAEMWLSKAYQKIYQQWFGPNSLVHIPISWEIEVYPY